MTTTDRDPASLTASLTFHGLDRRELEAVFGAIAHDPMGQADIRIQIQKPAIGGRRHTVHLDNLSVVSVQEVAAALERHLDTVKRDQPA